MLQSLQPIIDTLQIFGRYTMIPTLEVGVDRIRRGPSPPPPTARCTEAEPWRAGARPASSFGQGREGSELFEGPLHLGSNATKIRRNMEKLPIDAPMCVGSKVKTLNLTILYYIILHS